MNFVKPIAVFSTLIFIGIVILASYAAYKIYFQKDLYEEVTNGSYKNYSIGDSKNATILKFKKSLSQIDGIGFVEASFRDSDNILKNTVVFDLNDTRAANTDLWMLAEIWVFYLCEEECDWRKRNRWISFKFQDDKLSRVAEYEKRRWTE